MAMQIRGGGGGGGYSLSDQQMNNFAGYYARNMCEDYKRRVISDLDKHEIAELEFAIDVIRPISTAFFEIESDQCDDVTPKKLLAFFRPIMETFRQISNLDFDSSDADKDEFINLVAKIDEQRKSNEDYYMLFDLGSSDFRRGITECLHYRCNVDFYEYLHECNTWI